MYIFVQIRKTMSMLELIPAEKITDRLRYKTPGGIPARFQKRTAVCPAVYILNYFILM